MNALPLPLRRAMAALMPLCALALLAAVSPRPALAQTCSVLHTFGATATDGQNPYGGVVFGPDGSLYGTTNSGGAYNGALSISNDFGGTVFKIAPGGAETVLHSFGIPGSGDGDDPYSGVVLGPDGSLYGTTQYGGPDFSGEVFKIAPDGTYSILHTFGVIGTDGKYPYGGVVLGPDGSLYGTTYSGGAYANVYSDATTNGGGTVFKIAPGGTYSILYSFGATAVDGQYPFSGVVLGPDGSLYGTTSYGGVYDSIDTSTGTDCGGTVFKIAPSGAETVLHSFGAPGSGDGLYPYAGVVLGPDGSLYGTTPYGGVYDNVSSVSNEYGGTVFKIAPGGTETVLHSFGAPGSNDGEEPYGGVALGPDGSLYGTTQIGGAYANVSSSGTDYGGTVFKIAPGGAETVLHSFGGPIIYDGEQPYGGVVLGPDGSLYGTTHIAGAYYGGTVFKLTLPPTHSWTATSIATGSDGVTRMLWDNVDGQVSLWTVSANGSHTATEYGPYEGWTAIAVATASDNTSRILWDNEDGQASLWTVSSTGSITSTYAFGPFSGWTADALAVAPDGTSRILWDNTNGTASLWTVSSSGSHTAFQFGPFTGWSAVSVSVGADGKPRLLWDNTNGTASLWTVSSSGSVTATEYGPFSGWHATGVSTASDNTSRLLWDNTNGAASLWTVSSTGSITSTYAFGPFSGWTADDLAVAPNGTTSLLWDNVSGLTSLWGVSGSGSYTATQFGPF